jgi:hypothetical protein
MSHVAGGGLSSDGTTLSGVSLAGRFYRTCGDYGCGLSDLLPFYSGAVSSFVHVRIAITYRIFCCAH